MIYKRSASLTVATVIGAMLIATAAHARSPHVSRLIVSHRQFVPAFTPISTFYSYGPSYQSGGVHGGFVRGRAFVDRSPFITPVDGVGVFYEPFVSCWTWVPADFGWQRVWECR
jgi:hypothetical protein